jgi:hypothetical protein
LVNAFSNYAIIKVVNHIQSGKLNYPGFMDAIANSGARFYEATLQGKPRVTCRGTGGYYG